MVLVQIRVETRPWQIELPTRKLEVELTTISSNYHVEINPGDVGFNDRYVVQEIIKELAKNRPMDPTGKLWTCSGVLGLLPGALCRMLQGR